MTLPRVGGCQRIYGSVKGAAGISDKYWLFLVCDHNNILQISIVRVRVARWKS